MPIKRQERDQRQNREDIKMKSEEDYPESTNKNNLKGKFTWPLLYCTVISVIGGTFAVGWNIGVFNTPSTSLKQFINTTYTERYGANITSDTLTLIWSFANGLLPLGGAFGGLLTGISVEKFGHLKSMLIINILVVLNGILFAISKSIKSYETLLIGRFMSGFISGYFCGVGPLYMSELPPENLRGFFGTINALAICAGALLSNVFGLPAILGSEETWPYLLSFMLLPALVHLLGLWICIDSPKYLYITKNDPQCARKALEKLRNHDKALIDYEMNQLAAEKQKTSNTTEVSYMSLFKKAPLRRALIVSVMLQAGQQFSGVLVVSFYSAEIFKNIGLDEKTWAVYASILVTFVETIMHGLTMFLIDRTGRRFLLIMGMIGMSLCCFLLAVVRIVSLEDTWFKVLGVASVVIYITFYSFGLGPIPLLATAELFNTETRGKAVSLAVFANWFLNFVVSVSFPFIDGALGGYSFVIYGGLLIFFAVFTFFKVPETKNKPIDEILKHFE